MILPDIKILSVNRGKYKDLSIRFLLKREDYHLNTYELLCDQAIDGTCGTLVWLPDLDTKDEKPKDTLLSDFRTTVVREFGDEVYRKVKERFGVAHLKDIPGGREDVSAILSEELFNLRSQAGFYDQR